ncbi:MAG: hypothetical protein PQJ46_03525 [Spirochaetales bacterium]|nr:hypothetical protein [Spirochaetales bacterium]
MGISFISSLSWFLVFSLLLGVGSGSVGICFIFYIVQSINLGKIKRLYYFFRIGNIVSVVLVFVFLKYDFSWQLSYRIIGIFQICLLIIILIVSTLYFNKIRINWVYDAVEKEDRTEVPIISGSEIEGVIIVLLMFSLYCALESTIGLWG